MTLLIGALIIGLILALLALGVLVSFRIFSMPDITTDGSITLGASIAAVLLVKGVNPVFATMAGALGGAMAGAVTGVLILSTLIFCSIKLWDFCCLIFSR